MISKNDLEYIRADFSDIDKEYRNIEKEIWGLEELPIVKKYIELQAKKNALATKRKNLYGLMKYGEYENCNHLWGISMDEYGEYDYVCVKCGLNYKSLRLTNRGKEDSLSFDERVMASVLKGQSFVNDADINLVCDKDLAMALYKKIKEHHPDIDDKTAVKYLEIALEDIRNIEVSEKRKKNRAKRLGLRHDFNRWK
ncbi:MAG TPA: hypothetical protein IAB38_03395 [Candidatus Onthousia excrementipullorum]|uniref:Uncharacterized protein n=1 Tax=Candidatus Onthousia excrementipullorum TaxID=2840884 RepID=A0A9D1DUI0_9FIRM|nr:hypothetical protein [Candidatus Onthousia excrementipullorum]